MKKHFIWLTISLITLASLPASALRLEKIKYADFSSWASRTLKDSGVIGGKEKTIYEVAPNKSVSGNKAFKDFADSPWETSSVYAKVMGVSKASGTVFPFDRGGGNLCAKMTTILEKVKAVGIINMDVMVAGTIFLGRINEPITSPKGPFSKMEMGIPYTKRPVALVYDFKVEMPEVYTKTKATGFGSKKTVKGRDNAEVYVLLQRRWEDAKGNIYAKRVGTGRERYSNSIPWTNGHQLKINYGDISEKSWYKPWMGLLNGKNSYYAKNSKGKLVPVQEIGWDDADATPTHVLVMASSSCGEPYVGTEGITLYIDNIAFGF